MTGYMDEIVTCSAPRWAWEIIENRLAMSGAFSPVAAIREDVLAASRALAMTCEETDMDSLSRQQVDANMSDEKDETYVQS